MTAPAPQRAGVEETAAARDVLAERRRQVEAEGWTPHHDDCHNKGELANAAACYAAGIAIVDLWPWSRDWWKPRSHRRNLVKAAALILAEIERIDRAAQRIKDERRERPGEER